LCDRLREIDRRSAKNSHFRSLATDSFPAFRPDKKTPDEFYFEALPAIPLA
jgi:hypothetical protein